jgi:acyl-CoA synthetase (AMP-forming)/AMP-acid ligase II
VEFPLLLLIKPDLPRTAAGKVQKVRLRQEINQALEDRLPGFG